MNGRSCIKIEIIAGVDGGFEQAQDVILDLLLRRDNRKPGGDFREVVCCQGLTQSSSRRA